MNPCHCPTHDVTIVVHLPKCLGKRQKPKETKRSQTQPSTTKRAVCEDCVSWMRAEDDGWNTDAVRKPPCSCESL